MKRIFLSLVIIFALFSCDSKDNKISTDLVNNPVTADGVKKGAAAPAIQFDKTEHDFGKILQGEQVCFCCPASKGRRKSGGLCDYA